MKMINLDYVEDVVIKKEVTTPANGTQCLTPLNIEKVVTFSVKNDTTF